MDYNKKKELEDAYQKGYRKGYGDCEDLYSKCMKELQKYKKEFRQKLATMNIVTIFICMAIIFINDIYERMMVLPTAPYNSNKMLSVFIIVSCISFTYAVCILEICKKYE